MSRRANSIKRTTPADAGAYSYLLGMYLGDGYLGDSNQLRFHLDAAYPGIVIECAEAMEATLGGGRVRFRTREGWNVWIIDVASVSWPLLLPQHGPGRKHDRLIALEPWQQDIVDRYPKPFLRGLIHSDGCRTINRFTTTLPSGRVAEYAYPRYFFTNRSEDIKGIFCAVCDRLGIRWTRASEKNISVAHRRSVALLDEFIGPKA